MEAVESSLKQMALTVAAVQQGAVPGLATWGQKELDEKQRRWDTLSKQVRKERTGNYISHSYVISGSVESVLSVCVNVCVVQLQQQQERATESQEKVLNLKKDLAEMREWMAQVDEEFLMRDFEYKSPEELEEALQEMKVHARTYTHSQTH